MSHAREIAVRLLDQVRTANTTLDHLMDEAEPRIRPLNRPDRALVHALVYGVLRWQGRLDWVIDHLASKSADKLDPMVRIILRLGIFQIQFMDRIPTSAAVNTSVELTKKLKKKWAAGFTNAILRGVDRRGHEIPWPRPENDPQVHLAVTHAFPEWLISRWYRRWGFETTDQLCRSINAIPSVTLRVNTLKLSRSDLMQQISNEVKDMQPAAHSPEGIHLSSLNRPLPDWPTFRQGLFQVQGEAAQLIAHMLTPQPGERLWDACAGLGTKSAHIAELMDNQGQIMASDVQKNKLKTLEREMQRLGIDIVKTCQMDLSVPSPDFKPRKFDRILIDAPCSGLGVLQRNPDGKWRTRPEDIRKNSLRQKTILSNAAAHLKPGGVMTYVVCSMESEENEMVAEHFLQNHPEFGIYRPEKESANQFTTLQTPEGFLRTTPHEHGMDGFFAAAFKRTNL